MKRSLVAIGTYGSHRVKGAGSHKGISAYKIGYTGATAQALLAVFKDQSRDVASKRASYHYIHIDQHVQVKQDFILLRLTEAESQIVAQITRNSTYSSVYLWRDGLWLTFPNVSQADFHTPVSGFPRFEGTGLQGTQPGNPDTPAKSSGILVERSQRDPNKEAWFWLSGNTFSHRDLLKRYGCRWSKKRKSWYFIGSELPSAIQTLVESLEQAEAEPELLPNEDDDPCSIKEAEAVLGVKILPKFVEKIEPDPVLDEPEEAPKVRVIKPVLDTSGDGEAHAVLTAIRQTKPSDFPIIRQASQDRQKLHKIPQSPCGELTGSITGNVWSYGWAIHEGICIYLNLGGPRTAVEAIRAKMSKGDIVNCVPWDAPAIELTAGEGNTGMYADFMQNIPEAKFTSLILLHEMLTQPNYGGSSTTFIFHVSDEQAMAQLRHHITKLVKVPVFLEWTSYLWHAGQTAMLLRPTRTGGDVKMYTVVLDSEAWTRLITGGLAEEIIVLPD